MTQKNQPVGWAMLKSAVPDMIMYVVFIGFLIVVRPPIYVTAALMTVYVLVKMLKNKRFAWVRFLKACVSIYIFLAVMYGIYYFLGGTAALILAHVFGITVFTYARWEFIKKCDRQIKQQLDVIIEKRKRGEY